VTGVGCQVSGDRYRTLPRSDQVVACRRTVRKGSAFPEASLTTFPEAEPQEKIIKGNLAESHRHSALCGGKPQSA
jgi:hypothetical protein